MESLHPSDAALIAACYATSRVSLNSPERQLCLQIPFDGIINTLPIFTFLSL
jgi:hypothetical protein